MAVMLTIFLIYTCIAHVGYIYRAGMYFSYIVAFVTGRKQIFVRVYKIRKDKIGDVDYVSHIYSLLHLGCHFFILKSQSMIWFSRSLLQRSVEKRPRRLRLEIGI